MTRYAFIISLFVLVVAAPAIRAAEPVAIGDSFNKAEIGKYIDCLEDTATTLTLEDVVLDRTGWKDFGGESISLGFVNAAYWMRFTIDNRQKNHRELYLEIDYPMLDYIDLYLPRADGTFTKKSAGDHYRFEQRDIKDRNFIFILEPRPGLQTFYLRIATTSSLNFRPIIWSRTAFLERTRNEYPIFWMYYGLMLSILFYHLFLFLSLRDLKYLYYSVFILSYILFQFSLNGLAYQYLWPGLPWWQNNSLPFFMSMTIFSAAVFVRRYQNLGQTHPRLNGWVLVLCVIPNAAWALLSLIIPYRIGIIGATALAIVTPIVLYSIGAMLALQGSRTGKYLIIGFSLLVLGVSMYALKTFGALPVNFITQWGIQFGSSAVVILLSLGLADEIYVMKGDLQYLNLNLERKVEERTRELEEAREKLLESDKIKSSFFANISHEIRTPLTLILSPVESVLMGTYGEGVDEGFFRNIQRNTIRLLRLINNLLDFSKIEAGRMKIRVKELDIVRILKNYIGTIELAAVSRGIVINFSSVRESMVLYTDIEKVDKIAYNLFSNALKFTESGGMIEVRVFDDERFCHIAIEDTGIGIPADKMGTIFDRFSQVDQNSTRKFEGTGIGLSLVREFLEIIGGNISVESRYIGEHPTDHGTAFTVSLPKGRRHFEDREDVIFIDEEGEEEPAANKRRFVGMREMYDLVEYPALTAGDLDGKAENDARSTVLIVEDNADMRNFLTILLKEQYRVIVAVDGMDGLEKAQVLRPDLIITDIMMPKMNGSEMTRRIKEDEDLRRTPVIMLTAVNDISHKIDGLERGADDYLTKPFNSKELLARVRSLLKIHEYEKIILSRNEELENDLRTARMLQRKLLPEKIPELPEYRSHVIYIPMDLVGGDFYDYKVNQNNIELFIADVSGHGLPGAFIATITKMAYESISFRNSTRDVLRILNDIICRSTVEYNFVTVFYCIINRESNILSYSNAGHFPPLIYRAKTDEFFELQSKGTPLGWFRELNLEETRLQLEHGDRLVFYTDGITECRGTDEKQFGDRRFKEFIRSNVKLSPEQFNVHLLSRLREFSGKEDFDDDLCCMVFDVR